MAKGGESRTCNESHEHLVDESKGKLFGMVGVPDGIRTRVTAVKGTP
jgi:hypothetical protein